MLAIVHVFMAPLSAIRRCVFTFAFLACFVALGPRPAAAWGDEGHEIIALLAERFLDPAVRAKIAAILAADPDKLTAHDIASAATWADRYRDSDRNGSRQRYEQTRQWHFVDVELADPNLDRACFDRPPLPAGTVASNGPSQACVVDKIEEFLAELSDPKTDPEERLVALKFVLHLVGDLHQPLHAADDHDAGGNRKRVAAEGVHPSSLHHFWDTEWVARLGDDPRQIATELTAAISDEQRRAWSQGTLSDWVMESFAVARKDAYGLLPEPSTRGVYVLDDRYVDAAVRDVRLQLSRAGVRLALLLNKAIGGSR
jgi:hypothetical protein